MKHFLFFVFFIQFYFSLANCNQPNFCDRNCWDPNGTHPAQNNPTFTNVTHMIVHHTGDGVVFPPNTDYADKVRYYWDLHVNTNGWSDIGYNWLIDRNGIIYEGRGDGVLGAHFSAMNTGTMGVALIGDFTLETPSQSAINSLENLIAWEATDKNINVTASSFHASSNLVLNNVSGHLDGVATACPGTDLYNLLPSIRNNVNNLPCYNGNPTNGPDLVIEDLWTVPANPQVGENVDLYVTIKNVGDAIANNISLDYFIDGSYVDDDTHSSLDPNEEKDEYENNYVFNSSGVYNYCVFIDAVTNEQNTTNNSYCINVNVGNSGGSEDVTVTNATASPTTVNAGDDIDVSADQNYSGSQTTSDLPNIDLDYYLSTDCNLSSDDILLGTDSSSIGSNDTTDGESETLTIPSNTVSGTYYIIFSADNDNEINESNENNNIACVQITVGNSGGSEDVTVTNVTASPTTVNAGDDIDVSADQNYSGSQTTSDLPNIDLDYYLSTDCNLSSDDILLGTDSSSIGSNDTTDGESETLTIPSNTVSGTYYIIFSADNDNEINESNENNNIACVQITVEEELSTSNIELKNQFKVYPNPTFDIVYITSENNISVKELMIYDINGRLLRVMKGDNLDKVSLSDFANGIYFLHVNSDLNRKMIYRILKN